MPHTITDTELETFTLTWNPDTRELTNEQGDLITMLKCVGTSHLRRERGMFEDILDETANYYSQEFLDTAIEDAIQDKENSEALLKEEQEHSERLENAIQVLSRLLPSDLAWYDQRLITEALKETGVSV